MGPISPLLGKGALCAGDSFSDPPPASKFAKWFYGVILPAGIWIYDVSCCLSMQATLLGRDGTMLLSGAPAIAYGIACINVASFLHFHYFWGNVDRLCGLSDLGKTLAALGFVTSLGYLLYHFIMLE